jgi:hypothetical protein
MTPVALASLLTGSDPARHGLLGQVLYCDGEAVDVFQGPLPEALSLATPGIAQMADHIGIHYHAVLEHRILKGSLTELLHRHTRHVSTYIRDSGLSEVVNAVLSEKHTGIVYVYSSGIDSINHRRGAYSAEWRAEIENIDRHLGNLATLPDQATWLWITADHGHIPMQGELSYQELAAQLPWLPPRPAEIGSAVSVNVENMDALQIALQKVTTVPVRIVPVTDHVNAGYFGEGDVSPFLTRLGDHLLIPESGFAWSTAPSDPLCWSHGGAHPAETTIPWVELRL